MLHARKDYDRIQDLANLIPADEPVFLIRCKDKVAPTVVLMWALLAEQAGAGDDIVASARRHAQRMMDWQDANAGKVKIPDMPKGQGR